ncbi:outer membrane protein TolC [Pseudomonas sp. TE6288]
MFRAQQVVVLAWLFSSCTLAASGSDRAELMAVYRQAVEHNTEIAAARADFAARQEALPQARANLLPAISVGSTVESTRLTRDEPERVAARRFRPTSSNRFLTPLSGLSSKRPRLALRKRHWSCRRRSRN